MTGAENADLDDGDRGFWDPGGILGIGEAGPSYVIVAKRVCACPPHQRIIVTKDPGYRPVLARMARRGADGKRCGACGGQRGNPALVDNRG